MTVGRKPGTSDRLLTGSLDRTPEFVDGFEVRTLDPDRWLAAYLPQWSSRERSAPTVSFEDGRLVLAVVPGQGPWCPEWDGETRVSSIQTGCFAGALGSSIGQHRFADDVVVREAQPELRLYTPQFGRVEIRAAAEVQPDTMVALWMIGFEDRPEDSGEICVVEVFGRDVSPGHAAIGMGVHPHHDPRLHEDFARIELGIDVSNSHEYAIEWTEEGIEWAVDGRTVRSSSQSPRYPMQLMLGTYAFREIRPGESAPRFVVESVRGYPPSNPAVRGDAPRGDAPGNERRRRFRRPRVLR